MENQQQIVYSGGVSFFGLLLIVLIALKLTGLTTLSWWWVLLPIYIIPVTVVGIGIIAILGIILVYLLNYKYRY